MVFPVYLGLSIGRYGPGLEEQKRMSRRESECKSWQQATCIRLVKATCNDEGMQASSLRLGSDSESEAGPCVSVRER